MVANLGIDEAGRREPAAAAARGNRPPGGRRSACARGETPLLASGSGDAGADAADEPKPKKPRNRKYGRPR